VLERSFDRGESRKSAAGVEMEGKRNIFPSLVTGQREKWKVRAIGRRVFLSSLLFVPVVPASKGGHGQRWATRGMNWAGNVGRGLG
jgi:hypothetical protein